MSDNNSYELLGLTEASTFEEIQSARDRLIEACGDEPQQKATIEAAYDAILMERLRLRQEGKIKVPDRIRFAENVPDPAPTTQVTSPIPRPDWITGLVDTPSRDDILWPALTFVSLALLGFAAPSLSLAVALGASVYFLNRKENKFWRSLLLTMAGLGVGLALGLAVGQGLLPQGAAMAWASPDVIAAALTCLVLWATSSFLR